MAFLLVYIREAHPDDAVQPAEDGSGMMLPDKKRRDGGLDQPKTYEERQKAAQTCKTHLELDLPFVVDTMTSTADRLYGGWPERIYVISREGKIHYKSGLGPSNFKPAEAEAALKKLL